MNFPFLFGGAFFIGTVLAASPVSEPVLNGRSTAYLVASNEVVVKGGSFTVGLVLDADEGWHNYWVNPGDFGMATTVNWTLPDGVKASPPAFPVPHRFEVGGLFGLGYSGRTVILTTFDLPADFHADQVEVKASVSWLTCDAEGCVPGDAVLGLNLPVGTESKASDALIEVSKGLVFPVDRTAEVSGAGIVVKDKQLVMSAELAPQLAEVLGGEVAVYIEETSLVRNAEPPVMVIDGRKLSITAAASEFLAGVPKSASVVLVPRAGDVAIRLVLASGEPSRKN